MTYHIIEKYLTKTSYSDNVHCVYFIEQIDRKYDKKWLEMPGIEPGAFHMQSERSTAELHPLVLLNKAVLLD